MWKRLATFVLTASFSVVAGTVVGVDFASNDDSDESVFDAAAVQDAERLDDAVDDRIAAWVSLREVDRDVAEIHIEPIVALNAQLLEHLLTPVINEARRADVLKLIINALPPQLIAESDLRTFMQQRGFHDNGPHTRHGTRIHEFYTNLYYHPKDKPDATV